MKNEEKGQTEQKKLTFKDKLKDKRERAKIELLLYGIFFVVVIIFVRISSGTTSNIENNNTESKSFISLLEDNYEYDIIVTINNDTYEYYGKVLGNNSAINLKENGKSSSYYLMNKKYYILENDNYILTDEKEVYPYIDYRYLDLDIIKQYIEISTKENNTYTIKVSELLLNSESDEKITINIEEGDKNIVIDYTNLFKQTSTNTEKIIVNITYSNIGNIISLEE